VNDDELGAVVRALRHRRGWRQSDLATRARVSATLVRSVERGHCERVSLSAIRRVARALDLRLRWDAGYRGAELARLRDADHAACAELIMRRLRELGWVVRAEVSFNHYGDRGRIDLIAFHAPTGTLLVVEIKTVISDVQGLLGGMDVKERVAATVARSIGFRPRRVVPMLVIVEGTTNRRRLREHASLFSRFGCRGRSAAAWLRSPTADPGIALLVLAKLPNRRLSAIRRAGRQRVRLTRTALSTTPATGRPAPAWQDA
jgi:transcriptional regulator with XRE-family HTH domain